MFSVELLFLITILSFGLLLYIWLNRFIKKDKTDWKTLAIQKQQQIRSIEDPKLLILEYDKLVEFCLQNLFFSKLNLGQLLKLKKGFFSKKNLDRIWTAHKIRNKLVHDINFILRDKPARHAIMDYEKFIDTILKH